MTQTKVIYNGSCPICSREIAAYRRYAEAQALPMDFTDLNETDLSRYDLTPGAQGITVAGRQHHAQPAMGQPGVVTGPGVADSIDQSLEKHGVVVSVLHALGTGVVAVVVAGKEIAGRGHVDDQARERDR